MAARVKIRRSFFIVPRPPPALLFFVLLAKIRESARLKP
jgi:hypothetical protein